MIPDILIILGVALIGVGVWFTFSWPIALITVGSLAVVFGLLLALVSDTKVKGEG